MIHPHLVLIFHSRIGQVTECCSYEIHSVGCIVSNRIKLVQIHVSLFKVFRRICSWLLMMITESCLSKLLQTGIIKYTSGCLQLSLPNVLFFSNEREREVEGRVRYTPSYVFHFDMAFGYNASCSTLAKQHSEMRILFSQYWIIEL